MNTVAGDMETFVFDMLDAITGNKKDRAFQILYNILYSGKDAFSIIGAIVSQFELLLSVKAAEGRRYGSFCDAQEAGRKRIQN